MFHMDSPGAKTHEIVREIDEFIQQGRGEYGQKFTPETCHHRIMGMMTEIPISSEGIERR